KPLTIGVPHRVAARAARPLAQQPAGSAGFINLVSLPEIIGEISGSGPKSKKVIAEVDRLVATFGPELHILCETDVADLSRAGGSLLGGAGARPRPGGVVKGARDRGGDRGVPGVRPREEPPPLPPLSPPAGPPVSAPRARVRGRAGAKPPPADATGASAAGALTTSTPPANGQRPPTGTAAGAVHDQ